MQAKHFLIVLSLGLALLVCSLLALNSQPGRAAPACNRYVVEGGNDSWPDNQCNNSNNPCKTVQYALTWASAGERICVADRDDSPGASIYHGTITITRSVTLDGAWAAHPNPLGAGWVFTSAPCAPQNVVLSGGGTARVISITNASPTIYCFTITGGNAQAADGDANRGGGIAARDAAPVIIGNIITANYGCVACSGGQGRGGGVYLINAPATAVISGNLIANNVAASNTVGWGGGIYLENASPQVLSNTVQANRAGHSAGNGGGIAVVGGSPLIADNHILENTAAEGGMGHGGGIFVQSSSLVTIERNRMEHNVALRGTADADLYGRGGGLFYDGPLALIRDNRIYGNAATTGPRGMGGGMYLFHLSDAALVAGNVISENNRASYATDGYGGGLYLDECQATVAENQVIRNIASSGAPAEGGGVYINGGSGLIRDNIIADNEAVVWTSGGWAYGGGMSLRDSNVLVQGNLIARNEAAYGTNARGVGGGVYAFGGSPRFVGNQVLSNSTGDGGAEFGYGGGFSIGGGRPWLDSNVILDNRAIGTAGGTGGGVDLTSSHIFTLTNNIIARNGVTVSGAASAQGSGVAIAGSGNFGGHVAHNTIAENRVGDGVGVCVLTSTVLLYNNIIVSQTTGIINAVPAGSTVTADHTLFEGNGANYGPGVTSTNEVPGPARLAADYHLTLGSNAINRALPLAWVTRDIDGDLRPMGAAADVGADEVPLIYLPLVLRNF